MLGNTKILSEYHKKMNELSTREARKAWCLQVEEELGSSMEPKEDRVPPGLRRVRKLENDILKVVSRLLSSFPPLI